MVSQWLRICQFDEDNIQREVLECLDRVQRTVHIGLQVCQFDLGESQRLIDLSSRLCSPRLGNRSRSIHFCHSPTWWCLGYSRSPSCPRHHWSEGRTARFLHLVISHQPRIVRDQAGDGLTSTIGSPAAIYRVSGCGRHGKMRLLTVGSHSALSTRFRT